MEFQLLSSYILPDSNNVTEYAEWERQKRSRGEQRRPSINSSFSYIKACVYNLCVGYHMFRFVWDSPDLLFFSQPNLSLVNCCNFKGDLVFYTYSKSCLPRSYSAIVLTLRKLRTIKKEKKKMWVCPWHTIFIMGITGVFYVTLPENHIWQWGHGKKFICLIQLMFITIHYRQ